MRAPFEVEDSLEGLKQLDGHAVLVAQVILPFSESLSIRLAGTENYRNHKDSAIRGNRVQGGRRNAVRI